MLSITSPDFAIQNEPKGLREMSHRVYFSDTLNGYLEEFTGELMFSGADYTYLRNAFFSNGCAVVPVEIMDGCGLTLSGNLFLNDADWRPDKCTVTTQVVDSSFLSLIDNNKSIKAFVNVGRSKNDLPITAVTQSDLKFKAFDVVNNTDTPANRHGVRVYDALRTLVEFMSDGLIGFESDFFFPDDDPAQNRPRIPTLVTGRAARLGVDDSFVFISFEELYTDLNRLYNLSFAIERTGGNVILRIEPSSYFRQTGSVFTISNPNEVKQSADASSFYAKMKFGSSEVSDFIFFPSGTNPVSLPFVQWSQEEYHLGGQCNTDTTLDLQLQYLITDTNTIMRCLPHGAGNPQSLVNPPDQSFDDNIFIVLFDASNETIVSTNPIDSDLRYYNGRLNNQQVAERWGDGVPFPIFLFLGGNIVNDAEGVVVSNITATTHPTPPLFLAQWMFANIFFTTFSCIIEFPTSTAPNGYDPSSNLQTGARFTNFRATWYTAPLTNVYSIEATINYDGDMNGFVIAQIRPSNPIATRLVGISDPFYGTPTGAPYTNRTAVGSFTNVAASGDEFYVVCFQGGALAYSPPLPAIPPIFKPGCSLEVFAAGNTITQTYDPQDNFLINTEVSIPHDSQAWQTFLSSIHTEIEIGYNNGRVTGHLKDATRRLESGITDWVIRSNFASA
jgi:hypothetical protein